MYIVSNYVWSGAIHNLSRQFIMSWQWLRIMHRPRIICCPSTHLSISGYYLISTENWQLASLLCSDQRELGPVGGEDAVHLSTQNFCCFCLRWFDCKTLTADINYLKIKLLTNLLLSPADWIFFKVNLLIHWKSGFLTCFPNNFMIEKFYTVFLKHPGLKVFAWDLDTRLTTRFAGQKF